MQRIVSVFLVVIAFGSTTGLAWMLARPTPPDPRVATLQSDLRAAQKEIARLREQVAQHPAAPAAIPGNAAIAATPQTAAASGGAAAAMTPGSGANLREVLATPGMRAMMEQQQAAQIDMGYGRLFDLLHLKREEKANLRSFLLDREKGQMAFALKMMDPNLSLDERKQLLSAMQAQKDKDEQTIKSFLNDAKDFVTFKDWEATQPERLQFEQTGRNAFAQEPLSAGQEEQLITLAAKVRQSSASAAVSPANPANMDPAKMTETVIQNYAQQLKQNDDRVAAEAVTFLTPNQLKTLQTYQAQVRSMAIAGIKMSATLTGPGGK